MKFFDVVAPFYEVIHPGAVETFKSLNKLDQFRITDRVLDLGGGKGRIAKFLADQVREIIVLDSSPGMVKRCEKEKGLTCILGLAEKIPFEDNYFDKVIIIGSFHHFQDQEKTCREINRVLKENGRLIIEEVNPNKFFGRLLAGVENLILKLESRFHSPQSLAKLLAECEFKIRPSAWDQTTYYLVVEK